MLIPQCSWGVEDSFAGYDKSLDIDLEQGSASIICPGCGEELSIWDAMMECLKHENMTAFEQVTRHVVHGCGRPNAAVVWFWRHNIED